MVRPSSNSIGNAADKLLDHVTHGDYPDIFKRDELKSIYEKQVVQVLQQGNQGRFQKVAFGHVVRELKRTTDIHELGDYFCLAKDIQVLYDKLSESPEFKETIAEWQERARQDPNFCGVCGIDCQSEKNFEAHVNGNRHRMHQLHIQIYQKRDSLIVIPPGLAFDSDPLTEYPGLIEKQCKPGEKIIMQLTLENISKDSVVVFSRHVLLWDTGMFKLREGSRNGPIRRNRHLNRGLKHTLKICCSAPEDFGHHCVPMALYFLKKTLHGAVVEHAWDQDFVLRFLSLHVIGDMHEDLKPTGPYEKKKPIPEVHTKNLVPGEPIPESNKNLLKLKKLEPCKPPERIIPLVYKGLSEKMEIVSDELRRILTMEWTMSSYQSKFDLLLWCEELQMMEDIKRYDLEGVTMEMLHRSNKLKLEVPGLAERRPSVLRGDRVKIYPHGMDRSRPYEGIVHRIELEHVHLGVNNRLLQSWMAGQRYDVRFTFSPVNLWLQHRALKAAKDAEPILFPGNPVSGDNLATPMADLSLSSGPGPAVAVNNGVYVTGHGSGQGQVHLTVPTVNINTAIQAWPAVNNAPAVQLKPWFDRNLNDEQKSAVRNIVQGTSKPAPYIIFGPPGTGKTVTITETIRQVYQCMPDSRILVCCPENTAADLVMERLISESRPGMVQHRDIYRMYAQSRTIGAVPNSIQESKRLNYDEDDDEFYYRPGKAEMMQLRILVVTLSTSGRLVSADFPKNHFSHIFIDEGGHATEPECIVPLVGLVNPHAANASQIVLAGDPKQLGPILRSQFSLNFGLDKSLMERLMHDRSPYQRPYDNRYITKLVNNYRSHDHIIAVPRALFYDGELNAAGDEMIINSMLDWNHLPNKKFPMIFHSVFGTDEREKDSPSWFNRDEVAQVDKYLHLLLKEQMRGQKLEPKDIGIISPYRKQVSKLREMIKKKNYSQQPRDLMVGSVEEFQGQEFKVILISTVRSSKDSAYTDLDLKFNLGFLRNPKRFNVAITRARALLIVIGNPITLEQDNIWREFINYCDKNRGFLGGKGKYTPDHGVKAERERENAIELTGEILYQRGQSAVQQEDPEWQNRD